MTQNMQMRGGENHIFFMSLALKEAQRARQLKEVPVGAVVVRENAVLSKAYNLREKKNDPLGHAELLAIRKAARKLNSWRLEGCKLYVSLEPCLMCMGSIIQARLSHLIYACEDPKEGFSSRYGLLREKDMQKKIKISSGPCAEQSSLLLKTFFRELRKSPGFEEQI